MPYPYTTRVTRADSDAILAFLKTIAPVNAKPPPNELSFPFSIRSLLHGWKLLYFHPGEFKPDPGKSAPWNRGAYLVTGLGHCGACHTPKNCTGRRPDHSGPAGRDAEQLGGARSELEHPDGVGILECR